MTGGELKQIEEAFSQNWIAPLGPNVDGFEEDLKEACQRLKKIKVTEMMHPVHEHIDKNAHMSEAIHKIVMWQTLSILVTSKNNAVGILRLADLFQEVFRELAGGCKQS